MSRAFATKKLRAKTTLLTKQQCSSTPRCAPGAFVTWRRNGPSFAASFVRETTACGANSSKRARAFSERLIWPATAAASMKGRRLPTGFVREQRETIPTNARNRFPLRLEQNVAKCALELY